MIKIITHSKISYFAFSLPLLLLLIFHLSLTFPVFAKGEFSSIYDVTYDVGEDGQTEVAEKVTLKNLTDRYYPSDFKLVIAATQISDLSATDNQGALQLDSKPVNGKTQIDVKFNQQVAGKDKEYTWTLRFKSKDFAQNFGKIWEVSVPKLASSEDILDYNVSLLVPVAFGDPSVISPSPIKQMENAGKLQFNFSKEQILKSGVSAIFGDTQLYSFKLTYNLSNKSGFLPKVFELGLPANTAYQKVIISSIEPKPDNVVMDEEGNYLALVKLDRSDSKVIEVDGMAQLSIKPLYKDKNLTSSQQKKYLAQDKYWEKDNPLIKEKLLEIFKDKNPQTNAQKAELINQYITSVLQFNNASNIGYRRLGAVTALNNPNEAKCYEFSDLFIAMARSANIPTRENIGLGYRGNSNLRPECFPNSLIHIWPEFYDQVTGNWIMVDPTWEVTTGGASYFTKFDLNHLSILKQSQSEMAIQTPVKTELVFSTDKFNLQTSIDLTIDQSSEVFGGLPATMLIRVKNSGNNVFPATKYYLSSAKILIGENTSTGGELSDIPPFGQFEKNLTLKTGNVWDSYEDIFQFKVGDKSMEKRVLVKPLFAYKRLFVAIGGIIFLIVGSYITALLLHLKSSGKSLPKIKKPKIRK